MEATLDLKQPRPLSPVPLLIFQLDFDQLEKQACPLWERLITHQGELAAEDRAMLGADRVGKFYLLRVRYCQAKLNIQREFALKATNLTSQLKQCREQLDARCYDQDTLFNRTISCQNLSKQLAAVSLHDIKLIPKIGIDYWVHPLSSDLNHVEKLVKGIVQLLGATTYQQAQKAWGTLIPLWSFKSPLTRQQWSSRRSKATEAITAALVLLAEPYRKHERLVAETELKERCQQLQSRLDQIEREQAQAIAKCGESFSNRIKALLKQ